MGLAGASAIVAWISTSFAVVRKVIVDWCDVGKVEGLCGEDLEGLRGGQRRCC